MEAQLRIIVLFLIGIVLGMTGNVFAGEKDQNDSTESIRPFQITFISPLGTNGLESSKTINRFSINILAGVSGGVRGTEIGGFCNFTKGDVYGASFAGLGNYTSGSTDGLQVGGLYNVNTGPTKGGQFAGITNVTSGDVEGGYFAGIANVTAGDKIKGAQFAGIVNVAEQEGTLFQLAGISNVSVKGTNGTQISGIVNHNGKAAFDTQIAGIVNTSFADKNCAQISGIANFSKNEVHGAQIAGIVNYTRKLYGLQLGLINVCDSIKSGLPVGLMSIAKNGYYAFELETNESFYINATYKMGVKSFYNIFTVGVRPEKDRVIYGFGAGFGSMITFNPIWGMNIEATCTHINEDEWWTNEVNLLNRLKLNFSLTAGKITFFGGPSFNVEVSNMKNEEGALTGSALNPSRSFYKKRHYNTLVTLYPGFNFGLRL